MSLTSVPLVDLGLAEATPFRPGKGEVNWIWKHWNCDLVVMHTLWICQWILEFGIDLDIRKKTI